MRTRGFRVGLGPAGENGCVLLCVSHAPESLMLQHSFVVVRGKEKRDGLRAGLNLMVGRWVGARTPRPSSDPFIPFYAATSLTTRLASACRGTMKACGTGNLEGLGDWPPFPEDGRCRGDPISDLCHLTLQLGSGSCTHHLLLH